MRRGTIIGGLCLSTALWLIGGSIQGAESREGDELEFGPWSRGSNLGPFLNTDVTDAGPRLADDGLALYFYSARPGGLGGLDIWVARRLARDLPWETPVNIRAVNTSLNEFSPAVSEDGRALFFSTNRPGGLGRADIWFSTRTTVTDDEAWSAPAPLTNVNSPLAELTPFFVAGRNGRPELYFASDRLGSQDLFKSELGRDGAWTAPEPLAELNTAAEEQGVTVRGDGLELIFASNRDHEAEDDLYVARRERRWEPWSTPERVGGDLHTSETEFQPEMSSNGRTLYFTRWMGTHFDLFASTRALLPAHHR